MWVSVERERQAKLDYHGISNREARSNQLMIHLMVLGGC